MKKVLYLGHLQMNSYGDEIAYDIFTDYISENYSNKIKVTGKHLIRGIPPFTHKDIKEYNFILIGGGTCITSLHRPWATYAFRKLGYSNIPYGILGAGVYFAGDERKDQKQKSWQEPISDIIQAIQNANYIGLRDEASKFQLLNLVPNKNIDVIYDPGLSVTYPKIPIQSDKPIIGINICDDDMGTPGNIGMKNQKVYRKIYDFIINYSDKYNFIFLPFNSVDTKYFKIMKSLGVGVYKFSSTKRIAGIIQNCKYFIGIRVHSDVTSAAYSIPFLSVAYTYPNLNFLNHIEYNWRIQSDQFHKVNLNNEFNKLVGNRKEIKGHLTQQVTKAREAYKNGVERLCKIILES